MADVGLDAELILAIDAALAQVGVIESALNAATTAIPVDLDYLSSVGSFSDALAQVVADVSSTPVDVPVAADTSAAEASIGALADAPPVDVPVDADTATATASIDALGRDVPPITIEVDADLSNAKEQVADLGSEAGGASESVAGLEGSITGLGAAAGIAEGSAKELVSTIGELGGESGTAAAGGVLGLAAATGAFFEEGLNAVSAGQRFDLVLGNMANKIKEIDVNGLNTSMEELGIKFGSTGAEMENVNSKLFQMAINSGASKDQAVLFTQQIETLSARAISLNPQLGTLADVTDALGNKIGRGGRFAAQYGLDLNAAEISTRALADTGKAASSDLTFVEKAMAGAELASEKYGAAVAGSVGDGSKNAAIQVSELKARFKEAIEQIGVPVVAPVLDILKQVEPDAVMVAEALGRLGKDALPAVEAALLVINPPLQVVSYILHQIPDGVIAGTLAFFGLRFAMEAVAQAAIADEAALFALSTAIPWLAAISAGIILVTTLMGDSGPYVDDATRAIDSAAKGFEDLTVAVGDTVKAENEALTSTGSVADNMVNAGLSTDGLTSALLSGGEAWDQYRLHLLEASSSWGDVIKSANELDHLRDKTEEAAQAALDKAVNDEKLTKAEEDNAIATAGQIDGKTNYAAALDSVQPKIAASIKAEADQKDAEAAAAKAAEEHAKVLDALSTSNVAVAMTMENVRTTTGDQTAALAGLALALGDATLGTKDLDAVAQELGVTTTDLKGFISDITTQVKGFVDAAMAGLPKVGDAIDRVLNPPKEKPKAIVIDPEALQAELDDDINRINGFNLNLQVLINAGFSNLAQIASQRGPEFTTALVTNLQNGGTEATAALDAKFGEMNTLTAAEPAHLREVGVGLVTALGDVGRDASKAFGDTFSLEPTASSQVDGSRVAIADKGPAVVEAVNHMSADAAERWAAGFGQVDTHTATVLGDVVATIDANGALVHTSASTVAQAGAEGFATGIAGVPGSASSAMSSAASNIDSVTSQVVVWQAWSAGDRVGAAFDQGLAHGIGGFVDSVTAAAAQVVDDAEAAARRAAQTHSPSKVWEAIGLDMTAGLASGLAAGSALASDAAGKIVETATMTTTVRPMPPVVVPPGLAANHVPEDVTTSKLHDVLNRLERQLANLAPVHVSADRPPDLALAQSIARQVVDQRWRFGQ